MEKNVFVAGIPRGIDFCDVLNTFLGIEGVVKVHNLRIWALSLDKMALAAHLAVRKYTGLDFCSQRVFDEHV